MSLRVSRINAHGTSSAKQWSKNNMLFRKHEMPHEVIHYTSEVGSVKFTTKTAFTVSLPYLIYNKNIFKTVIRKTRKCGIELKSMRNIGFNANGSIDKILYT